MTDTNNQNEYDFNFLEDNDVVEEKTGPNYIRIGAIILLLLLIGSGIYYWVSNKNNEESEAVEVTEQETDMETTTDTQDTYQAGDEAGDNSAEQTNEEQATPETSSESSETETTTGGNMENTTENSSQEQSVATSNNSSEMVYFIVSGAFKEESNAQKKLDQLTTSGYKAVIVGQNSNGLYIVAYEGFDNINDAKTKLKEIRTTDNTAWIYKKTN